MNGLDVARHTIFIHSGPGTRDLGVRSMCDPENAAKCTALSEPTPVCAQASACDRQSGSRYKGGRIRAWTDVILVRGCSPRKAGLGAGGCISEET